MRKKSKERTFSCLRRKSPLENQGVKGDSLLARGFRQGVKTLFQHPVRNVSFRPGGGKTKAGPGPADGIENKIKVLSKGSKPRFRVNPPRSINRAGLLFDQGPTNPSPG